MKFLSAEDGVGFSKDHNLSGLMSVPVFSSHLELKTLLISTHRPSLAVVCELTVREAEMTGILAASFLHWRLEVKLTVNRPTTAVLGLSP